MRKQKGFSLIELLIVVAIILVIAAIAVPNLMKSKAAANEASAVGSLRTIVSAEAMYFQSNQQYAALTALATANLVDNVIGGSDTPTKSGYKFGVSLGTNNASYTVAGSATSLSVGNRDFCSDNSAVIRSKTTDGSGAAAPTACDATFGNPIQ